MRTIEEIRVDIENMKPFAECGLLNHASTEQLEIEFRAAITKDIPLYELEQITQAKADGMLVMLPKGRVDDYVKWYNGIAERLFQIHSIIVCRDGMRYDLGDFYPFVDDHNIHGILTREQAEAKLKEGEYGSVQR